MIKLIRLWLGLDEIERKHAALVRRLTQKNDSLKLRLALSRTHIDNLNTRVQSLDATVLRAVERTEATRQRVEQLADIFAVGLDWSPSGHDKSWVVVCIKGKMERVQFIDMSEKSAQEIRNYLSIFNQDNVTVDAGPSSHFSKHL